MEAADKVGALSELAEKCFFVGPGVGLPISELPSIISSLEEREAQQSTGIKDGLAIPHAKIEGIDELLAALGVSEAGIDFGALDGRPSHIFIVLLSPERARGVHLKALARISRLFSSGRLAKKILSCAAQENAQQLIFDEVATEDARY